MNEWAIWEGDPLGRSPSLAEWAVRYWFRLTNFSQRPIRLSSATKLYACDELAIWVKLVTHLIDDFPAIIIVAGYSPDEIERIVTVIQTNITQAQNLYSSAVQLISASSEVKLGFLMAHSSLHILSEQIDSLTVQHQLYTENLHQLNISYSVSYLDITKIISSQLARIFRIYIHCWELTILIFYNKFSIDLFHVTHPVFSVQFHARTRFEIWSYMVNG